MKSLFITLTLSILLTTTGTNSYAETNFQNKQQVSNYEVKLSDDSTESCLLTYQLDCGLWFYMPCPVGTTGGGTLFWSGRDCETGAPAGFNLTIDLGCEEGANPTEPMIA